MSLFDKLKEIHPDLDHIRITDGRCQIVFKDGTNMERQEFKSRSKTYELLDMLDDVILDNHIWDRKP